MNCVWSVFCPPLQAYSDGQLSGPPEFPGPLLPEQDKKKGRNKRAPKGGEKPISRYKKRRKDGEEKTLVQSSEDTLMTQLKQVTAERVGNELPLCTAHTRAS